MTIQDRQEEIIQMFSELDDWMDKYEYIIGLGKSLKPMDPALKTQTNLISGCQSRVWLDGAIVKGTMHLYADSDALITKGLIHLLLRVLDRQPPEAILNAELDFIDRTGLGADLSPSRAHGLASIVKQIKTLAREKI